MTSGNGHGGRRSGTGRPRRGGGHRNNLLGTSSASLARKFAEEAVRTAVAIMRDEHASAWARVNAAKKLLYWGYGPPSNHLIEVLTPPSQILELPTQEEIMAEIKRRGLLSVIERIAKAAKSDDGAHVRN
jgi:hypothetical protein